MCIYIDDDPDTIYQIIELSVILMCGMSSLGGETSKEKRFLRSSIRANNRWYRIDRGV